MTPWRPSRSASCAPCLADETGSSGTLRRRTLESRHFSCPVLSELMNAILTDSDAPRGTRRRLGRVAWEVTPLALIFLTYAVWLLLPATYGRWPLWIVAPAVTLLLTLHS